MNWKIKIIITSLILLIAWIVSAPLLAKNLIVEKPLEEADAIMVLSGSSVYVERTHKAAELYKRGTASRVLLTDDGGYAGWSQKEGRNPPFVYLAKQELIAQGVAEDDIEILEPQVTGTIWEARNLKAKIKKENWRSIVLVTSSYHTKRALNTFSEILGDRTNIGISASPTGDQTPPPFSWWLSAKGWQVVGGEYVKSVVYWIYY
ncbi:MAG: YdcF family protein [Pyrinomonadaceae bacterium]|nr:YdcF family protein [Pyrinomonadaceae bacterium]